VASKVDEKWLHLVEEAPLEPDLPIIDAHVHIWPDRFTPLVEHFGKGMSEDFLRGIERSGHDIRAGVHVTIQANHRDDLPPEMIPVAETAFLEEEGRKLEALGPRTPMLTAGIVAGVDMLLGDDVERVLDAHCAASPDRIRGVRHPVAWHPSPLIPFTEERGGILIEPAFIDAARHVARRDLSLDVFVFYNQLPDVMALARAVPDLPIVLNHSGGIITDPRFADQALEIISEWRASMRALAACENVVVKLGGMGMPPLAGNYWTQHEQPPTSQHHADWQRPYVMHIIDNFAVDRVMFQSNFPTEKPSANYGIVWNAFKRIAQGFGASEKSKMFFENAKTTYRLDGVTASR
jgi:predicted TIM-barrel fold metal-dependent hydrolase